MAVRLYRLLLYIVYMYICFGICTIYMYICFGLDGCQTVQTTALPLLYY